MQYTYKIIDSVSKIKKDDWDSVFQDNIEGYQFHKTLEESKLDGFTFYYIILYRSQEPLLIAPLFIADFNLDIAAVGFIEKIIQIIRKFFPKFLILKALFCGSPFGEHGVLGISKDAPDEGTLINELVKILYGFSREKNIPLIIFKDFLKDQTLSLDSLTRCGFFKVKSFPSVVTELSFSSFDGYLKSLSYSTRKSLRRKIKKAYSGANIRVEMAERVDNIIDDVYRLYENTYHSGSTKFERLTKEFFINVAKNLYPYTKFFLYYVDGRLAAFNLCFVYQDLLIDKFIGFDYDISNQYSLYFVSWCFNIEWCLKNAIHYYQSGQTDYGPKIQLGGKVISLYAYLKHRNNLVNSLLGLLAGFLKPENFDENIRNNINV